MVVAEFKRGTIFRHGSWLDPATGERAVCRVTAVRKGLVYYGFGRGATKGAYYTTAARLLERGAEVIEP